MAKKLFELAKELNVTSKELQEKATQLGISVTSHMSVLSDTDIEKLAAGKRETKIVHAEHKQTSAEELEPKVTVKPAKPAAGAPAPNRPKPPIGRPVVDNEYLANKHKPPVGKPVVNTADLDKRDAEKAEAAAKQTEAAPKAEPASKPAEAPKAETPAQASKPAAEAPKTEAPAASKPAEHKPYEGGHNDRPQNGDRPQRSDRPQNGDRPQRSGDRQYGDRPQRSGDRPQYGDRPQRSGDRPQYGDRPQRSGDRPQYGDRPQRSGDRPQYGDRPQRSGDRPQYGDRPQRSGDRPQYGDRPQRSGERSQNGDRPQRSGDRPQYGDRPQRSGDRPQYGDRPQRSGDRNGGGSRPFGDRKPFSGKPGDSDRPAGRGGDHRPARKPGDKPAGEKMETKPGYGKRSETKKKGKYEQEKDRNKFAKLEKRSLEKVTKKKYTKQKPQVEEVEIEEEILPEGTIVLNVPITVAGFCEQTEVSTSKVIMTLMKMGIMANINQNIDEDMAMILASELGISVAIGKVNEELEEDGIEDFKDKEKDLKPRPPVITVMGHVDHGKTSILDAIRKTNVTASESGGITQHIGASEVKINGHKIVFLDTPGHEAFTAMRARGAHITDIAVLVVAADDSVKPQTIESISHAKAAGVPIIVAINKMDKPGADPDRVKKDLADNGVLVEEWGGEVISVPVSAKTGDGIKNLLEMILLQAEVLELKANPNRLASGSVIEARLDKAKGPVASLLIMNGTLQAGQSIVAGTSSGRIRLMTDAHGKAIKKAGPATAVEILGLTDVPQAGDIFNAVSDDKTAREIASNRAEKLRGEVLAKNSSKTLEQLFSQIQEGETKELNLIVKGDVQGSVGAMITSLEKLNNENVRVNVIHSGVGTVTESDVMLAGTSGAIIIGFNVRPSTAVQTMADRDNIEIRTYRVIYDVIDDIENAMKGMLDPEFKEEILGKAEIRNTFKVPSVGVIGGAYITEGKVVRNAQIRLVRDGIVIHEGNISSLKRFKDDAKEVMQGYECGLGIENYNDIKEGDVIECFHMVEIERK